MLNKRIARLYAIQIVYQMDYIRSDLPQAVDTFLKYYERSELPQADVAHLRKLVAGLAAEKDQIKQILDKAVLRPWDRVEQLLRIILEVGCYELLYFRDIPAKVLVAEYTTIAAGFFSSSEPNLVNGVLEKVAIQNRPEEKSAFDKKSEPNLELLKVVELPTAEEK